MKKERKNFYCNEERKKKKNLPQNVIEYRAKTQQRLRRRGKTTGEEGPVSGRDATVLAGEATVSPYFPAEWMICPVSVGLSGGGGGEDGRWSDCGCIVGRDVEARLVEDRAREREEERGQGRKGERG